MLGQGKLFALSVSDDPRFLFRAFSLLRGAQGALLPHVEVFAVRQLDFVCEISPYASRRDSEEKRNENDERADQDYRHAYVEPAPQKLARHGADGAAAAERDAVFVMEPDVKVVRAAEKDMAQHG